MKHWQKATIATALVLALSQLTLPSLAGNTQEHGKLSLSPELSALLKAEMGALSDGLRAISVSLAQADWEVLEATSKKMHESYLLKKSLTPALLAELKQDVPGDFRSRDAAFHARALKLQQAAKRKDFELSAFHFSKLVESCAGCHSVYATDRFPGFGHSSGQLHEH